MPCYGLYSFSLNPVLGETIDRLLSQQTILVNDKYTSLHFWLLNFARHFMTTGGMSNKRSLEWTRLVTGEQWWHGGGSARMPLINVAWARFRPDVICCCFLPCSEGFSPGTPLFLPPQKPISLSSNTTRMGDPRESSWGNCPHQILLLIVYYYLLHLYLICSLEETWTWSIVRFELNLE